MDVFIPTLLETITEKHSLGDIAKDVIMLVPPGLAGYGIAAAAGTTFEHMCNSTKTKACREVPTLFNIKRAYMASLWRQNPEVVVLIRRLADFVGKSKNSVPEFKKGRLLIEYLVSDVKKMFDITSVQPDRIIQHNSPSGVIKRVIKYRDRIKALLTVFSHNIGDGPMVTHRSEIVDISSTIWLRIFNIAKSYNARIHAAVKTHRKPRTRALRK